MSSVLIYFDLHLAELGNDGDVTTFFHTAGDDQGSWWRVDLESSFCIQAVNLVNTEIRKYY